MKTKVLSLALLIFIIPLSFTHAVITDCNGDGKDDNKEGTSCSEPQPAVSEGDTVIRERENDKLANDMPNDSLNGSEQNGPKSSGDDAQDKANDRTEAEKTATDAQTPNPNKSETNKNEDTTRKGGDPVLLTSGEYQFDEVDITLPEILGAYQAERQYRHENPVKGGFGQGWISSLDTRIIRGTDVHRRKLEQDYKAGYVDVFASKVEAFKQAFAAAWGTGTDWRYTETIYRSRLAVWQGLESRAKKNAEAASALASLAWSDEYTSQETKNAAGTASSRASSLYSHIRTQIARYQNAISEIQAEGALMARLEAQLASAWGTWAGYKAEADLSDVIMAQNGAVLFPGTPEYMYSTGFGTLNLIDEAGIAWLYVSSDGISWRPRDESDRASFIQEDGSGGFILNQKGGVRKYYNSQGLYTGSADRAGNRTTVLRTGNRVQKVVLSTGIELSVQYTGNLITRISGPLGQSVSYGYNGEMLSSVTDIDGDTVRYSYEGGRLKRIIKPDGNYIELTYGADGPEGVKLVSATTHEEGYTEHFQYYPDQKLTVYTNHSGMESRYWYNERHRIIEETHGDGSAQSHRYDTQGFMYEETINGALIQYTYDSRGNISSKQYHDGTSEQWTWNNRDQQTVYLDRDRVRTEWTYDVNGNCTRISQGGVVVFTGQYNGQGQITALKRGNRETEQYTYDIHGYLSGRSITSGGETIRESWTNDALGRVTRYIDGAGREWRYTYGAKINTETGPAGLEKTWVYNSRKDLTEIREKDTITGEVRVTKIKYDKRHLPVEVTDGAGNITKYEYRADGLMTKKQQGPWVWEYEYEAGGRLSAAVQKKEGSSGQYRETYSYSWQGYGEEVRSVSRPGAGGGTEQTGYQIDAWGRVKAVTNAAGETSERSISGAGRLAREQGQSGGFFAYEYDAAGRLTAAGREGDAAVTVRYNNDGSIAAKTDRNGIETRYEYDGRGLMSREITAAGEKRYQYDGAGRVIREETVTAASIGGGVYYTEWAYDSGNRQVTVTVGNLYPEVWELNGWGEPVKETDGEGNTRRWAHNGAGQLVTVYDGYGKETRYEWYEIGKIAKISYADGSSAEYEYNHLGQASKISDGVGIVWEGVYDNAGRLWKETGRPGINREYRYDSLGRIVEVKNGGDVVEQYRYGNRGREVTFIDGKGTEYRNDKNAYGEFTQETNRLGDRQSYSYDQEGRLIGKTDFAGKNVVNEYTDNMGTVTTRYSDGASRIIMRDRTGNIVKATGSTGTISYQYDAGGKLIKQSDGGARETTEYRYDRAGRRIRMQSGNRDVVYSYGKNNELLRVVDNTQRLQVNYKYDVMNREIERVYGNGVKQETFYDQIGRTVLIKETGVNNTLLRVEAYLYDGQGRRSHSADEKGNITQYLYDNQSRLQSVLYPWTTEKADQDKAEAEEAGLFFTMDKGSPTRYSFDNVAVTQLRAMLNRAGPALGNIINSYQMVWRESYTYDANGNRASKETPWGIIRYSYDAENRLVQKEDIRYTYDKDGNLLSEKGLRREAEYRYDGQNRMTYSQAVSHIGNSQTESRYAYDALGRRTLTQDTGRGTVRTLYDGLSFETIREGETFNDGSFTTRTASGAVLGGGENTGTVGSRYRWIGEDTGDNRTTNLGESVTEQSRYRGATVTLYGRGEPVGMNRSAATGTRGGAAYLGKDLMGSVRSASDDMGNLEERYEYDAFGKPYMGDLEHGMNLGYTGKPYDSVTGLYNYGYRDYSPELVRFTTVDPIRDGNNWFAYVNNDPVNYTDPWGLSASDKNRPPMVYALGMPNPSISAIDEGRVFPTESTRITSTMGKGHEAGIDIGAVKAGVRGDPVVSPVTGTVIFAGINPGSSTQSSYIIIAGNGGTVERLLHTDNITVKDGDRIYAGQHIADMSDVGSPDKVHTHYETYKDQKDYDNRNPTNPLSLYSGTNFIYDVR